MNGFVKVILWVVILSVVGYFGYQTYTKWWDTDLLKSKTDNVQGAVASTTQKAKSFVEGQTAEIKEKAEEYTDQVVEEAKNGILDFVKEKIGEGVSSLGDTIANLGNSLAGTDVTKINPVTVPSIIQNYYQGGSSVNSNEIPAPTSSVYFQPPSSTSIIAGEDTPMVFSINSNVSYEVDWGDGNKDVGSGTSGNIKLLSHTWKHKGDYSVKFLITNGSTTTEYSFPIRVY